MVFPETVNAKGNGANFDLRTGTYAVFGVGGVSDHGIQDMNWLNFAPRVGVTYQVTPRTVIRTGYGWSYEIGTFGSIFGHNVTQNIPVLTRQHIAGTGFKGVFSLAQGPTPQNFPQPDANGRIPASAVPDATPKVRPSDLRMPRVMAYNVTVQHQLMRDLSVSIGYVGNSGRHQFTGDGPSFNANEAAFVPGVADSNLRKPFFKQFGISSGIDFYCNCANNRYDSLQIQIEKRNRWGYTVTGSFTYQVGQYDSDGFSFLYNRPLGYGNTDFLTRRQFVLAQNFDIPFGRGRKWGNNMNRAADYVFGGWNISGITTYYSGRPFTPNIGTFPGSAIRPNAGPSGRPDKGSADPYAGAKQNRDQWYLGGLGRAFLVPADNTFGNFPINTLYGPHFINQDLSMAKSFAVTERSRISLRAEAFNIFNHTNLGDPESNVTAGNAGQINGLAPQYQMRRLQFAARLDF